MSVDSRRYLEKSPHQTSPVIIEYQPSSALDDALHEFITPEKRDTIGTIALRSQSYVNVPLAHNLKGFAPREERGLAHYESSLKYLESHQIHLASRFNFHFTDTKNLLLCVNLLPSDEERHHLGRIALDPVSHRYSAVAFIPKEFISDHYAVAAAKLRSLVGLSALQSSSDEGCIKRAPAASKLWVEQPRLRYESAARRASKGRIPRST